MLIAYLNHQFEYKEYAREFSYDGMKSWSQEKDNVNYGLEMFAKGGAMLPVITGPMYYIAEKSGSDVLKYVSVAIGLPTAAITGGLFGAAWLLYHAVSAPVGLLYQNKPGLLADYRRSRKLADNWEKKLHAAALLFQCKTEPPHMACRLEFELYARLKETAPKDGCFNDSTMRRTVDNLKAR
jgi:hypothetical protein